MIALDLVNRRLLNHHLAGVPFEEPVEVVKWLGAVQSQEFYSAKWALALRLNGVKDTDLDQAFAAGTILRTHMMRPTWHFVVAEDIRWMQALTSARVRVANAYHYSRLELDDTVFAKSNEVIATALQGGKQLTRAELEDVLHQAGLFPDRKERLRFISLLMQAELDAVICSGALRGKQQTYALLEERVPQAKTLTRDEGLAMLTMRYFRSHGPATIKDFATWSGLLIADARQGIEMVKADLVEEVIGEECYWFSAQLVPARKVQPSAYLLPAYDEYTVGYKDRSAVLDPLHQDRTGYGLNNVILIDGRIVGIWKRVLKKKVVEIYLEPFRGLTEFEEQAVVAAAQQFGVFLDKSVALVWGVS